MDRRSFVKAGCATLVGGSLLRSLPGLANVTPSSYELTASEGVFSFDPKQPDATRVMFYNQSIPGPVIKIPQGKESVIQFHNALEEPSSIHWHGLRIVNAMDGVPGMTQALVQPGETFDYRFTPPDAGTYWYHTHQRTWAQLALGLAGVLIVEESHPPQVDQDFVFAVDDWRFNQEMQIDTESLGAMHDWSHGGRMGNMITVNGQIGKTYTVSKGQRIRFRMLNIANSRIMALRINEPQASVISIDGQPVKPYLLKSGLITLAPGQRSDLIIDITSDPDSISPIELLIKDQVYPVASFEIDNKIQREQLLDSPIALPDNPANKIVLPAEMKNIPLHIGGGAMGRMNKAIFQGKEMGIKDLIQNKQIWAFNGVAGLPEKPLFSVKRGTAISLNIDNDNVWPHAMHIHGYHFIDDRNPGELRDTALFTRQEKGSLMFIADNPGKWLIHCHMIEHQASGMLTWFEVV